MVLTANMIKKNNSFKKHIKYNLMFYDLFNRN